MKCPHCGHDGTRVVETREMQRENVTRRRRECKECEERFTTYERVETPVLTVVKEEGEEETFDPDKLKAGVEKACKKRPVEDATIQQLVDDVTQELKARGVREVESAEIGDMVIDRLKDIDKVAYLRFASIYRSFEDVDAFEEELEALKADEAE